MSDTENHCSSQRTSFGKITDTRQHTNRRSVQAQAKTHHNSPGSVQHGTTQKVLPAFATFCQFPLHEEPQIVLVPTPMMVMDVSGQSPERHHRRRETFQSATTQLLRCSRRFRRALPQGLCLLRDLFSGRNLLIRRIFASLERRLDLETENDLDDTLGRQNEKPCLRRINSPQVRRKQSPHKTRQRLDISLNDR